MDRIRVLIADDQQMIREGIEAMVQTTPDMEVVATVASGEEAINYARSARPHVVLLDIVMPGMNGIEAARWIKEHDTEIKIIIISVETNKDFVSASIKVGVDGYLPKDTGKRTLLEAIRNVYNGERYFNTAIKRLIFEDFYAIEKSKKPRPEVSDDLTKRELEVLAMVASGRSNKEVAEALFISVKTVETHKTHILVKLGLTNNAALIRYAIKHNIIST